VSAPRRLKATIAVALLTMTFGTQGCLPENSFADLASSSIEKVVDSALSAVLDCLLPSEPTAE
jgi:hypothetical protein